MRVAIIGSGVSGLVSARLLAPDHDVTVFEADDRIGGHANTVRVELGDETHDVDTGFIVYNRRNYPLFDRLLDELRVETQPSEMSFSVTDEPSDVTWCGTNLNTVFARRRNALDPGFWKMLAEMVRFNRLARAALADPATPEDLTLAEFCERHGFGGRFSEHYLIPMGAAIWSADPRTFDRFPLVSLCRFLDNHGLLSFGDRPRWRTVTGGSRRYVEALVESSSFRVRTATPVTKVVRHADRVELSVEGTGPETFDHVVMACHTDQALELLSDADPETRDVLGAIRYQPNVAVLHTDRRMLPPTRRAWASWNYLRAGEDTGRATLTYHLNTLQRIRSRHEICVTLNRTDAIDPDMVLATFDYAHPVYDPGALDAQRRLDTIQGRERTWFCGAWAGYGFHEDGVRSAHEVVDAMRASGPR
ncbi:MAG: FAD-dependent oxidoreductase [Actinomycetota bacterium]|nr:FAD-dependent oxidoreductase [Actinomycetota bacterium]